VAYAANKPVQRESDSVPPAQSSLDIATKEMVPFNQTWQEFGTGDFRKPLMGRFAMLMR